MVSIAASLGIGSGIDTQALVTDLTKAQRAAKDAQIAKRTESNTARISALATTAGGIDNFTTALSTLIAGGTLFTQPTVSDATVLSASAIPGSRLGGLSAGIEVKQLAQAQSLVSGTLGAGSTGASPVGEGTLRFKVGSGAAVDIAIGPGTNSLSALAQAINGQVEGVTASIVTGTTGAQLVLKGKLGEAQAFTVDLVAGDAGGLGRFAFGNGGGLTSRATAQNALLVLDGVEVSRASNSISDLVPGVKLELAKAAPGSVVTLGAKRPAEAITQAVTDIVAAYNELETMLDEATANAGADGSGGGALRGNGAIRDMRRMLARLASTPLIEGGAGPKTLAEIGVATNRDGSLRLDAARLQQALTADPDGVEALFNPTQRSDNPLVAIHSAYGKAKPGTYMVSNIVAQAGGTDATGTIAGLPATSIGALLRADPASPAAGLVLRPEGNVASATISIDLGLGGALQAIRDALRGTSGALTVAKTGFDKETESIAADKTKIDERSATYQAQLTKNFTAMDSRMTIIKAQQDYLTQQVALWTKSN